MLVWRVMDAAVSQNRRFDGIFVIWDNCQRFGNGMRGNCVDFCIRSFRLLNVVGDTNEWDQCDSDNWNCWGMCGACF